MARSLRSGGPNEWEGWNPVGRPDQYTGTGGNLLAGDWYYRGTLTGLAGHNQNFGQLELQSAADYLGRQRRAGRGRRLLNQQAHLFAPLVIHALHVDPVIKIAHLGENFAVRRVQPGRVTEAQPVGGGVGSVVAVVEQLFQRVDVARYWS